MLITLFISALTVLYIILMLVYTAGWHLQQEIHVAGVFRPVTKISIVIPARNEALTIGACIQSILSNKYPLALFEIIVIDDHSSDDTYEIVTSLHEPNVQCLKLSDYLNGQKLNSYKKKALETGIAHSTGDLIVTTDADCIVPPDWLSNFAALYEQSRPAMIIAPVAFTNNGSIVQLFQSIDFMTMQGITAAAYRLQLGNMSNGANLAFSREAFEKVNGYNGVDHLASGDDYLLMMKIKRAYPDGIAYLKSRLSIVQTVPQPDWSGFLNQRVRWASKSGKYDDKKLTSILLIVYLFNFSFLVLFGLGFYFKAFWVAGFILLVCKTIAELLFLFPVAGFFGKRRELLWFPFLQPLHIIYIVIAGFLGFIGKYQWKGRSVK